ncbi:MAG: hypothetical protein ACHQ2Y_09550 [Candidatus Lutacidiplasmatales archaeon]
MTEENAGAGAPPLTPSPETNDPRDAVVAGVLDALSADPKSKLAMDTWWTHAQHDSDQDPDPKSINGGRGPTVEYLASELEGARVRLKRETEALSGIMERENAGTAGSYQVVTSARQIAVLLAGKREVERFAKRLTRAKAEVAFNSGLAAAEAASVGQGVAGLMGVQRFIAENGLHPNDKRRARQELVRLEQARIIDEA